MTLLLIIGVYILGSVPFSLLFSRLFRLPDPRTYGSENIGVTNLMRSGKKSAAALTLIADMGKGAIPITWAYMADFPATVIAAAGVAGVIGHVFSLFLRLQGGKGVASALGVFLAWEWRIGIVILLVWTGVFFYFTHIFTGFAERRFNSSPALMVFFAAAHRYRRPHNRLLGVLSAQAKYPQLNSP